VANTSSVDFRIRNVPRFSYLRPKMKRLLDIVVASTLLFFVSPLFALLSVLIARDGGPVFFAHRRIGRNGKEFGCLKFRSMHSNATEVLNHLLEKDSAARIEWANNQKLRNDPRITKLGRVMRSTSIDELPQLINVLSGDMSLVGPRPIIAQELNDFYKKHNADKYYLAVRPGITGLWQVSGRCETTYEERIALDTAYVRAPSLRTDLAILARTVRVVLQRNGAY
jgi:exopolysaccharide production protein ExoY